MSDANTNPPVTPKSALDTLKEWKELIAFVALTLTSAVGGVLGKWLGGTERVQVFCWMLAAVCIALCAFVVHWKQKRKREQERRERLWAEREAKRKAGSAFRSLAPFEERDELPGKDRKVEARAIATRIASDDFRFGVVCGDTGCGKTSMLRSEVTRVLQAAGLEVAYVRNPRRLESKASEALPPTERLASELRALTRNYIKPTTGIVILDQFEEWFIEYQEPEQRAQIGKFIRKLAERPQRLRIVCAIRREFLIDFHDLSDELPQQLSTTNLFHIRNFTVDQARDVINECATADGLAPDLSFAETAAHDLAEGGQVRPPELQIVCTYLAISGGLSTPKYRQAGGTAGILAHYIQDALSSSRAPDVGARLLRALCDFPARAKRKPRTLDELTNDVNTEGSFDKSKLINTVAEVASHLAFGRILAEEQRQAIKTFVLMHDYLVDAVQLATADVSTKSEEANQLLRYYLAERRVIPLSKLNFIRSFAEARYLSEPAARRLLRKSFAKPLLWAALTASAALFLAAGFYVAATAQAQWPAELIGRHWEKAESGTVQIEPLSGGRILTGVEDGEMRIRVWDAKTARLLTTIQNPQNQTPVIGPTGKFVVLPGSTLDLKPSRLVNLTTLAEQNLPGNAINFLFAKSESWVSWQESGSNSFLVGGTITVQPLLGENQRHAIPGVSPPAMKTPFSGPSYRVSELGDRLVALVTEQGVRDVACLYDVASGKRLAVLAPKGLDKTVSFAVDAASSRVCTVDISTDALIIRLWNLSDGKFLAERRLGPGDPDLADVHNDLITLSFVRQGAYLILQFSKNIVPRLTMVLRTSDLQSANNLPSSSLRLFGPYLIVWANGNGATVWDVLRSDPRVIGGLMMEKGDNLILTSDRKRALLFKEQAQEVELWDFIQDKLITKLGHSGLLLGTAFTLDERAIGLLEEGSLVSLFDAEKGEPLFRRLQINSVGQLYYDPECRRLNVWDESGQVLRYTEGRKYFGKFVPSRSCN